MDWEDVASGKGKWTGKLALSGWALNEKRNYVPCEFVPIARSTHMGLGFRFILPVSYRKLQARKLT